MDINATDIAALEKILHQAEEWMLEKGESPDGTPAHEGMESDAQEMGEHGEGGEPPDEGDAALEIDIGPAPKSDKPRVLDTYEFYGGAAGRGKPPPPEEDERKPPMPMPKMPMHGRRR